MYDRFGPENPFSNKPVLAMKFYRFGLFDTPKLPNYLRIKKALGLDIGREQTAVRTKTYLESLKGFRDDIPIRLDFTFQPIGDEDSGGFDVKIVSTPALLEKSRRGVLPKSHSYNIDDVVQENKDEVNHIIASCVSEPYRGPLTDSEILEPIIKKAAEEFLNEHAYGRPVIKYYNQGDHSLSYDLLHAALSSYIHAIEWAIILHMKLGEDVDLIQQQKQGDPVYFIDLVKEVESDISQITYESLQSYNQAERRWIAHHREGEVPRTRVEDVRETFGRLVQELFREYV